MSEAKKTPATVVKHFLLDPIKTPKEATARMKELIPYLAISFGATLVFIILGMLIEPVKIVFDILGYICMAATFLFGWCMFRAFQLKKKLSNLECPNCKNIIQYDDNVSFEITSKDFWIKDSKTENSKGGVDIYLYALEQIGTKITCKCQECGTVKTFNHLFKTMDLQTDKQKGVSAVSAGVLLLEMKKTMEEDYKTRFSNASSRYRIKKNMTIEEAVKDYFCDDGTASKIGNTTISETAKK